MNAHILVPSLPFVADYKHLNFALSNALFKLIHQFVYFISYIYFYLSLVQQLFLYCDYVFVKQTSSDRLQDQTKV